MRDRAYRYLEKELAEPPPTNESWWPSYTAWQAFAVKVLVEGGPQPGLEHHAALRLSRAHAGLRAGIPARRAGRQRRDARRRAPTICGAA